MTDSTQTPGESAESNPTTPDVTAEVAATVPAETAPTEPIEPAALPAAEAPAATAPVAETPAAPVAATPEVATTPASGEPAAQTPAAPAAPIAPAAAAPGATPAPAAAPAAPAHPQQTGAFGQPVATVYAPNAAPQPYATQNPNAAYTQPTQPFAAPGAAGTPAPAKKSRGALPIVAALIAGALIGGASGAGVTALVSGQNQSPATSEAAVPQNVVVNNTDSVNEITAVAAKASPSVVTISVTSDSGAGTGSGVVLSKDGYVLTNTHVVTLDGSASTTKMQVTTADGKLYDATLVGTDPTADLAVIKLTDASGLTPLDFADSSKLNVGDSAIAIGAPLGLAGTVTNGIVSALNRSIQVASSAAPDDSNSGDSTTPDQGSPFDFRFDVPGQQQTQTATSSISLSVIQTDAAINPGNSGGALLNSKGELIGINVAIASASSSDSSSQSGSIGVGFAIPSNLAKRVADEIIKDGSATHGLLGASITDVTSTDAGIVGAEVKSVTSDGAAKAAGLQAGDIVTGFNGVAVTDANDLTAQVRALPAGAKADVTYVRDGKTETTTVTLGSYTG